MKENVCHNVIIILFTLDSVVIRENGLDKIHLCLILIWWITSTVQPVPTPAPTSPAQLVHIYQQLLNTYFQLGLSKNYVDENN